MSKSQLMCSSLRLRQFVFVSHLTRSLTNRARVRARVGQTSGIWRKADCSCECPPRVNYYLRALKESHATVIMIPIWPANDSLQIFCWSFRPAINI